jgi:hypothetical protein
MTIVLETEPVALIEALEKAGVEVHVCGQALAGRQIAQTDVGGGDRRPVRARNPDDVAAKRLQTEARPQADGLQWALGRSPEKWFMPTEFTWKAANHLALGLSAA